MSVMLAAKAGEAGEIYVTDKIDSRLAIASKEKAAWTGNPDKENITDNHKTKGTSWSGYCF